MKNLLGFDNKAFIMLCYFLAFGMDPKNSTLVGEPSIRQLTCGRPEEVGGVPRVPPQAQAPTRRAEGQARDEL